MNLSQQRELLTHYDEVHTIVGSSYRDRSTVIVIPTRGKPHERCLTPMFEEGIHRLIRPINHKRSIVFAHGCEVADAYNQSIQHVLDDANLNRYNYIMTVEDDNILKPDTALCLINTMETTDYDAVGAVYYTKGLDSIPMIVGNPYTDVMDFKPFKPIREIQECRALPMGATLWKMQLFRDIPTPWFQTIDRYDDTEYFSMSQDIFFCVKASMLGKKFAIDTRVRVGHLDAETGKVY